MCMCAMTRWLHWLSQQGLFQTFEFSQQWTEPIWTGLDTSSRHEFSQHWSEPLWAQQQSVFSAVVVLWTGSLAAWHCHPHDGNPLREGLGWTAKRGIPKWNNSMNLLSPFKTKPHTWKVNLKQFSLCHTSLWKFSLSAWSTFFSVAVSEVKPFTF